MQERPPAPQMAPPGPLLFALVGLAYLVLSQLVLWLNDPVHLGAGLWPAAGLTTAALLLVPTGRWGWVLSAVVVADLGGAVVLGYPLPAAVLWTTGNVIGPLVGATLVRRVVDPRGALVPLRALVGFLVFGVVVGPLVGATIGSIGSVAVIGNPWWQVWPKYVTGDALGVLVVAPVLLTWREAHPPRRPVETAVLVGALAVMAPAVFRNWDGVWDVVAPYSIIPLLTWAALRFGVRGAAWAVLWVTNVANLATATGYGPFALAGAPTGHAVTLLQLFLVIASVSALIVAALVTDLGALSTTVRDVTARRILEHEQRHAQRMDSVERLAGGMAHDFNNLLMGITGNVEMALEEPGTPHDVRTALAEIAALADRGAALTRHVLVFSGTQEASQGHADVNAAVATLHAFISRVIGDEVVVRIVCGADVPAVPLSHADLEQVLINLCVNARDAMPGGGTVRLTTQRLEDGWARISVSDDGDGMDAETAARACEPFFTTKGLDGTGLGLSMAHGLVARAGGRLRIDSAPGSGTTIHLDLPPVAAPAEPVVAAPCEITAEDPVPNPETGAERILVVDDDTAVREVVRRVLCSLGYEVAVAGDARAALALAADNAFDLLLTDVSMPDRSGVQLAAEIAAHDGEVRVLFMSGYPGRTNGASEPFAYLTKPFGVAELAPEVRAALAGPPHRALVQHTAS